MTVVVVEQSVNVALTLAERAVFMEKGNVRFEGPTQELLDRPDLLRSVFIDGSGIAQPTEDDDVDAADHRHGEACAGAGNPQDRSTRRGPATTTPGWSAPVTESGSEGSPRSPMSIWWSLRARSSD